MTTDPNDHAFRLHDPSENVKNLSEANSRRQDDLRGAEHQYNDLRAEFTEKVGEIRAMHTKEMADLRAIHAKELSDKEVGRLDSIRQVDRDDVAQQAAAANLAIQTLAKVTADQAGTLQSQVRATAEAMEVRRTADMAEARDRISKLELALSASGGKESVHDPVLDKLILKVEEIGNLQTANQGSKAGVHAAWLYVVGAAGFIGTILAIIGTLTLVATRGAGN